MPPRATRAPIRVQNPDKFSDSSDEQGDDVSRPFNGRAANGIGHLNDLVPLPPNSSGNNSLQGLVIQAPPEPPLDIQGDLPRHSSTPGIRGQVDQTHGRRPSNSQSSFPSTALDYSRVIRVLASSNAGGIWSTVDLGDARSAQMVKDRIFSKFDIPSDRQQFCTIHQEHVDGSIGPALTDDNLLAICRMYGDATSSLRFHVLVNPTLQGVTSTPSPLRDFHLSSIPPVINHGQPHHTTIPPLSIDTRLGTPNSSLPTDRILPSLPTTSPPIPPAHTRPNPSANQIQSNGYMMPPLSPHDDHSKAMSGYSGGREDKPYQTPLYNQTNDTLRTVSNLATSMYGQRPMSLERTEPGPLSLPTGSGLSSSRTSNGSLSPLPPPPNHLAFPPPQLSSSTSSIEPRRPMEANRVMRPQIRSMNPPDKRQERSDKVDREPDWVWITSRPGASTGMYDPPVAQHYERPSTNTGMYHDPPPRDQRAPLSPMMHSNSTDGRVLTTSPLPPAGVLSPKRERPQDRPHTSSDAYSVSPPSPLAPAAIQQPMHSNPNLRVNSNSGSAHISPSISVPASALNINILPPGPPPRGPPPQGPLPPLPTHQPSFSYPEYKPNGNDELPPSAEEYDDASYNDKFSTSDGENNLWQTPPIKRVSRVYKMSKSLRSSLHSAAGRQSTDMRDGQDEEAVPALPTQFEKQALEPPSTASSRRRNITPMDMIDLGGTVFQFRPAPEQVLEKMDTFFPDHDLDKPIVDTSTGTMGTSGNNSGSSSPTMIEGPYNHVWFSGASGLHTPPATGTSPSESPLMAASTMVTPQSPTTGGLGRQKQWTRMRILAGQGRRKTDRLSKDGAASDTILRRRSTKFWGNAVKELQPAEFEKLALANKGTSDLPSMPESPGGHKREVTQWVKGKLLATGTYAKVYLGFNATTAEVFVVKRVEMPESTGDHQDPRQKALLDAIKAESDTLRDLDHPNIIAYLGYEQTDKYFSIFLEYVPGGSIGDCYRKLGRGFDKNLTRHCTKQIVDGLAYLRSKGILHHNLKADNILVDLDGCCKISGFGISKHEHDNVYGANEATTTMQDSVFWMAPEVLGTPGSYDSKVDIWSLGCVVLEMCTGDVPWAPKPQLAVLLLLGNKETRQAPPVPGDLNISQGGHDFLGQCFQIDPRARPTAEDLKSHPHLKVDWQYQMGTIPQFSASTPASTPASTLELDILSSGPPPPGPQKPWASPTPAQPAAPAPAVATQQPEPPHATPVPIPPSQQQTPLPVPQPRGRVDALLLAAPLQALQERQSLEQLLEQNLPADLTGEIVADYQEMAHGGFAYVVKGTWRKADMQVAIKVIKARKNRGRPQAWESSLERRLNRELNVWAALNHPNIAEFLGFSKGFGDFPAMISKWCHLGTAADYLSRGVISPETRYHLLQDVADGLGYLHGLKIIHGDLKPTNILIDDEHNARLCDFGLVRLDDWEGPAGMTTTSPYTGTERYKAPELFASVNNRHPVATTQGDIYALACIMLEFVDTIMPYQQFTRSFDLMEAIKDGVPPAIRPKHAKNSSNFDEYFWDLLEACWSHIPENRPRVGEVIDILIDLPSLASSTATADVRG